MLLLDEVGVKELDVRDVRQVQVPVEDVKEHHFEVEFFVGMRRIPGIEEARVEQPDDDGNAARDEGHETFAEGIRPLHIGQKLCIEARLGEALESSVVLRR